MRGIMKANFESMRDLSLEERNAALVAWLNDLTTVYEKCALERDRLFEDYERLQAAAEHLANTVVAYFNKRGAAHAERKGNEDIAAMADALSDYGYRTAAMFTRRQEWPAQRLDDAARVTEEP